VTSDGVENSISVLAGDAADMDGTEISELAGDATDTAGAEINSPLDWYVDGCAAVDSGAADVGTQIRD
jgi:hypothetical protein